MLVLKKFINFDVDIGTYIFLYNPLPGNKGEGISAVFLSKYTSLMSVLMTILLIKYLDRTYENTVA